MNPDERLAALLEGFSPEDRVRLRSVGWAAGFLGVSPATVYRWTATGALTFTKLPGVVRSGGRGRAGGVRFSLVDVARFLAEREVGAVVTESPASPARVERDLRRLAG